MSLVYMTICFQAIAQENPKQTQGRDEAPRKVVFIIIDGISADMLKKANTPYIDAIAKKGAFTKAYVGGEKGGYSETPTISAVGYNSLLTGTWVNKHNVYGNSIKNPNYNYPTIFRIFKNHYPKKKTAIFSTWLDNRTKLVGEGLSETNYVEVDYAFDGFELDTLNFPHDPKHQYIKNIDKKVAEEAARYIAEEAPDLSWVYLQYTDDMGHRYGDSKQFYDAISFEDKLVGKIWKAVKTRQDEHGENWLLVVTTDHGRKAKDGRGHGGQSERERSTWILTNSNNTNDYFENQIPGIVDILPTITSFLNIKVDEAIRYEWDGVSLIDKVDAVDLNANVNGKTLQLTWKNLSNNNQKAKIYLSRTNHFKNGGEDDYKLLGEVSLSEENYTVDLETPVSYFYKIILETSNNTLNTWIKNNPKTIN